MFDYSQVVFAALLGYLFLGQLADVSAVSRPANEETEISARNFATRSYEQIQAEYLERRRCSNRVSMSFKVVGISASRCP